jgi:hypothetical protein
VVAWVVAQWINVEKYLPDWTMHKHAVGQPIYFSDGCDVTNLTTFLTLNFISFNPFCREQSLHDIW